MKYAIKIDKMGQGSSAPIAPVAANNARKRTNSTNSVAINMTGESTIGLPRATAPYINNGTVLPQAGGKRRKSRKNRKGSRKQRR